MISTLKKAYRLFRQQGAIALFNSAAKHIYIRLARPYLPCQQHQEIQGVTVYSSKRCEKSLDSWFGVDLSWPQSHKKPNCDFINEYVAEDDTVVVIGGGYGISSTVAAKKAGEGGEVLIYEGANKVVEDLKQTLRLNNVLHQTCVIHSIVGDISNLKGPGDEAKTAHPSDLPHCDVIEMDCEGAEINLIPELPPSINTILVETHPSKGAPTSRVEELLNDRGYQIVESEPDRSSGYVLVAEHIT